MEEIFFCQMKDPKKIHLYEFSSLCLCSAQTHAHVVQIQIELTTVW